MTGVAKGVEHMQERNYERGQIARNALQRRSDAFWTRVRAAQRRDAAARRNMLEGIRSRFDQMRNLFANVQERQDSQAQENKAALSSWVNGALFTVNVNDCMMIALNLGMVAKARSLSSWNRARKEKNKEAIRRMFDPERVFSNRIDTVEEEARAGGSVWDILGKGIDSFLGRNGEAKDEELPVW